MTLDFQTAEAGEMLEALFARLEDEPCRTAPVFRGGVLVGLVTTENVGEFLMIQAATRARRLYPLAVASGRL